jgi:DNA-binding NarL/FixJ family response regulator
MVRTLIVDDHDAVRKGIHDILEGYDHLEIVAEATDGHEAVQRARVLHPDLIIMDVSMPRLDGLSASAEIKKFCPETRIVMFSMFTNGPIVDRAKELGLDAYVSKGQSANVLLDAIDSVMRNQPYFPE